MVAIRVLQNPFTRSFSLHLFLLMVLVFFWYGIQANPPQNEPISLQVITPKNSQKHAIYSDKTRIFKQNVSAKEIGTGKPSSSRKVSVSDLGVKLDEKWSSHVLGDAQAGGDLREGLKKEETSLLNTQESLYYSFFNRVHSQLFPVWRGMMDREERRFNNSIQQLPDQKYFVTSVLITLNQRGEILTVQVMKKSGAVELDSANLAALNEAGPYPNPPKALLNAQGNAQFPLSFIIRN